MILFDGKKYESSEQDRLLTELEEKIPKILSQKQLSPEVVIDAVDQLRVDLLKGRFDDLLKSFPEDTVETYKMQAEALLSKEHLHKKLATELGNNDEYTKLTQYSINNKNKKDMWYTDLKNGLNNMKIKSTNFSSNVSYESYDKNENKNFAKDRNKKVTFIHVIRNNKNEKSLIDNKNKNKENKINKLIQSRIHACKTLKTIDEYTEIKKRKKNSHSRCKEKKNNLSCIKIHVNRTNKKDKEKSKSKSREKSKILNKMNLKKNNLNLRNEYKKKEKNNNDDKKGANIKERNENNNNIEDAAKKGKKKDSESIPKVKAHKSFFNSFLCCFECLNLDNKNNDINDNINKVPLTKLNTDINNKLKYKDKKSRNKPEKKKKK